MISKYGHQKQKQFKCGQSSVFSEPGSSPLRLTIFGEVWGHPQGKKYILFMCFEIIWTNAIYENNRNSCFHKLPIPSKYMNFNTWYLHHYFRYFFLCGLRNSSLHIVVTNFVNIQLISSHILSSVRRHALITITSPMPCLNSLLLLLLVLRWHPKCFCAAITTALCGEVKFIIISFQYENNVLIHSNRPNHHSF